jgi:hypothetical protein
MFTLPAWLAVPIPSELMWTVSTPSDDPKHDKDFTALVKLPPGAHSLKFIVDKQWKTSKYLPSATDADGNLVNYLQVRNLDLQKVHLSRMAYLQSAV